MALTQLLTAVAVIFIAYRIYLRQQARRKSDQNGCQPPPAYKHWDPIFGLDLFLSTGKAVANHTFLEERDRMYQTYGHTVGALSFGSPTIFSIHPDNLRTAWSDRSEDWGIQPFRYASMQHLCGAGFLTTDGESWKRSRELLKPGFQRAYVAAGLGELEKFFQRALKRIPGDGTTVDLQPIIFDLNSNDDASSKCFMAALERAMGGAGLQMASGPLAKLLPKASYLQDCRKVHQFANAYVDKAIEWLKARSGTDDSMSRILLYNMAQQTNDPIVLRDQIIQTLIASNGTTAALVSNTLFLLARHPNSWTRLRREAQEHSKQGLTAESLTKRPYLQMVLKESLRLHPVFPQMNRLALRDTILPTGGGPSRTSPIFCPKGTNFDTAWSTLHRSKEVFGADADEFRPERWDPAEGLRPGAFEYMPFGAGPRACLGQQKALMDAGYVVGRFLGVFEGLEGRDERAWRCEFMLTGRNVNGCLVALRAA